LISLVKCIASHERFRIYAIFIMKHANCGKLQQEAKLSLG